jgi:hypothetical protein
MTEARRLICVSATALTLRDVLGLHAAAARILGPAFRPADRDQGQRPAAFGFQVRDPQAGVSHAVGPFV